jgi:hypothetical protein
MMMRESIKKGDQVYIVLEEYYPREDTEITSRVVVAVFTNMTDAVLYKTSLEHTRGTESRFKIKGYTLDYHVVSKK